MSGVYQSTLNEVLASHGYTTRPRTPTRHAPTVLGKDILLGDRVVFAGTSVAVWAWLHKEGKAELTDFWSAAWVHTTGTGPIRVQAENHAAAVNEAAKEYLRLREVADAKTEEREPRHNASTSSAVARLLEVPIAQWQSWCIGRKAPAAARVIVWLETWASTGLPPIRVETTRSGAVVVIASPS